MRALVTGAGGFVGQYLCRALLRDGWSVAGTTVGMLPAVGTMSQTELAAIHWRNIDLRVGAEERRSIRSLLEAQPPDVIFHLAGVSYQPAAGADLAFALGTNVGGLVNLLEGVRPLRLEGRIDPVVLAIGSGEQYGRHEASELPLDEGAEQRPMTFYGATKQAQEAFALAAHRSDGLKIICTRSFNHSGRGQAPHFLLPSLVARAKAARTSGEPVRIGNTDVTRDFLHVEDVVSAYIALVSRGRPGEVYNVCSGIGVRVGDLAAEVMAAAGVRSPLEVDSALQRDVDVPMLVGDNAKLRAATGWTPLQSRSAIIQDLLDAAS
ncbi:MAG TPA: GDP-mannose 4,6-dehydratase [Gemmatimonadaceae bacterium]|nr:GDP-mannose 4,6-dehydratase [Gemmatimonadaceae bacterium]HRQ78724.1 GDP-mannose 4,6-dehydratase [Gemmatimonadaceae bacterium]